MKLADLAIPGPSHWKPAVSKVSVNQHDFELPFGDLVCDVLDGPSANDPYNSDEDYH